MTYTTLTTTSGPSLNLAPFTLDQVPIGSSIICRVDASGVDAGGNATNITIETAPVLVTDSFVPANPVIQNLTLTDLVVGDPVTATATISYEGGNLAQMIEDGWSVEWNWSSQQSSEGDGTLTYSITYEDPLFLGNDQYRTDDYSWTVRSESGQSIEHGTFIDGTPWIIDTGDLLLVNVSPREQLATIADADGVEATGMVGRTVINPDFGKYIPGTGWIFCRGEGETNPGAINSWTSFDDNKTYPFDFRAGNKRKPKAANWSRFYDDTQGIDVNSLDSGIRIEAGDMIVTQTPTLESVDQRCFSASYGCLTVMSPSWIGRNDANEYYRPPVNWDGYNTQLKQERAVMALTRERKFYENPITKPDFDYDSDTRTWTETFIIGSDTEPIIKRPATITPFFLNGDPGGVEGAGQKSVSIAPKTYPNYQAKEEEDWVLSIFDPEVEIEKRKLCMDIITQRGIEYFGTMYGGGYRLQSNGGHNPEYAPKLFFAWCITQDDRIYDMLDFKTGNESNETREEIVYAPDITGYPSSRTLYHEFCGSGLCMIGKVTGGTRHYNMKIESFDAESIPQTVTVFRPNTDVGSIQKRAAAGEIIDPSEVEYQKCDGQLADATFKMTPWDMYPNSSINSFTPSWTGGIFRVNGNVTRVIRADGIFEPYIQNATFSDDNETIDGVTLFKSADLAESNDYKKLYGMEKVAFKEQIEGGNTLQAVVVFQNDDYNIDAWLQNETKNIKVNGTSFSGSWSRSGRTMTHSSGIEKVSVDFTNPLTVEENFIKVNPDKVKFTLQTQILSPGEDYTVCDYANISAERSGKAFLRWITRGPSNCATEWGFMAYSYSKNLHTATCGLFTHFVGGYDVLPRWGKLRHERGQAIATQEGMNWIKQNGAVYNFQNGYYHAIIRQYLNDGNLIPTAPVDGPNGGQDNPDNWPPLPDTYTIEEMTLPPNGVSYHCGFQTVLNQSNIYESNGLLYSIPKLLYQDPDNPTHLIFDCSLFRSDSPNELDYQFFLDHNLHYLLHDTTTTVPLTEFSTTATDPTDNRFMITYTLPPEYDSVALRVEGDNSIILFEPKTI
jgi:hypothetical protein